jgi:hypothetical protein
MKRWRTDREGFFIMMKDVPVIRDSELVVRLEDRNAAMISASAVEA